MSERPFSLVTGGAGFIGSHLAEALLDAGHRVAVLDDLSSGSLENLPEGAEFRQLDVRAPEAAAWIRDCDFDYLFHLAAQMDVRRSTREPLFDAGVNILGTLNLLQAAAKAEVRQVVFASTGGAIYGEQETFPAGEDHPTRPVSPYGVAKLAAERYLYYYQAEHGLAATCLRYGNVYGERQNPRGEAGVVAIFAGRLLAGEGCTINGDGLQTRDYVHVSDVVRANLAALDQGGFNIYNVGTGIETTVVDLYRLIADAVGSPLAPEHGPAKPGEQRRSVVDAGRLESELEYGPPLPLAEGIGRTVEWFRHSQETSTPAP